MEQGFSERLLNDLKRNRELVDRLIEELFPRTIDHGYLEWLLGEAKYRYDPDTINETVFKPMWDLLDRGGKRWRPWLFLTLAKCFNVKVKGYEYLATAIELIHNGSLIADDIEDGAEVRRGDKAIHIKFGEDVAINLSSAMYFMPMRALSKVELNKDTYKRLLNAYLDDMIRIHFGQATDIGWHRGVKDPELITEEEYMQMCANKTGVLARLAAKFAAILANLSDEEVDRIASFAENIGVAFQIQDDILNITEAEGLGKELGEDITEGKITLMVIHTLKKATPGDRRRLKEILSMKTRDRKLIAEAIEIMRRYGAIEYAKARAREIVEKSWKEVEPLLPEGECKELLKEFAYFLINRRV